MISSDWIQTSGCLARAAHDVFDTERTNVQSGKVERQFYHYYAMCLSWDTTAKRLQVSAYVPAAQHKHEMLKFKASKGRDG